MAEQRHQMSADLARQLLGSEFICYALTWLLEGCIITSVWYYFTNAREKQDGRWLKSMVFGLFLMSVVLSLLNTVALYRAFVVHRDVLIYSDSRVLVQHSNSRLIPTTETSLAFNQHW
jgi:hypothetical protein